MTAFTNISELVIVSLMLKHIRHQLTPNPEPLPDYDYINDPDRLLDPTLIDEVLMPQVMKTLRIETRRAIFKDKVSRFLAMSIGAPQDTPADDLQYYGML